MRASISLGRLAGVEIGINWSWLFVFALITWSLAVAVFPQTNPGFGSEAYVAMAVGSTLLFFISLLMHEMGHAIQARREGMEIDGIVLWLFGGVAKFKGLFPSAMAELKIALAGPAVTLVIAVSLLTLARVLPLPGFLDGILTWLGLVNLILLGFNLLPALPLDGGRVFRALVWQATGDFTRATGIAGQVGRGFGFAMIFLGILSLLTFGAFGGIWLALIGWFLTMAAGSETRLATIEAALKSMKVSEAMASDPVTVPAGLTLAEFSDMVFPRSRHAAYPVMESGQPVGLLAFRDLVDVPVGEWGTRRVEEVMRPASEVLVMAPDQDLGQAAMLLATDQLGRALVTDHGNQVSQGDSEAELEGLLSQTDVSRLVELRSRAVNGGR
jgi:Zn-dependent protease/CBS domain-containing protein